MRQPRITSTFRSRRPVHRAVGRCGFRLLAGVSLAVAVTACVDDSATPIDPQRPGVTADLTDVTHTMEPTAEMRTAAEQQCLDDPDLAQGYIKAVDPNSDTVLAEVSVDCAEVR